MKKKMHDDQKSDLQQCIEYIEQSISIGCSYSEITKGLEAEFYGRYGTLRNLFSIFTPFSLNRYIRRRIYTVAYLRYKAEERQLSKRATYQGIKQFSTKFEREFGCEISGDYNEEDLQPMIDVEFFQSLNNALFKFPIVDSFKLKEENVSIEIDPRCALRTFLGFKSYFLPSVFVKYFEDQEDDCKIFFLELISRQMNGDCNPIALEELQMLEDMSRLYDLRRRKKIGNEMFVFCPSIPEFLHETYFEIGETLMPFIKAVIPKRWLQSDVKLKVYAISEADSFEEASRHIGMSVLETKAASWALLNDGLLRYQPT